MTNDDFERHRIFECNYQSIPCPQACGVSVLSLRANTDYGNDSCLKNLAHFKKCPFSQIECSFCGERNSIKNYEEHMCQGKENFQL